MKYKYHIYKPNDIKSKNYLDIFLNKNIYHNNTSYKLINLHELEKGHLIIALDGEDPIAMTGAVLQEENNIQYAKYNFRLAVAPKYNWNAGEIGKQFDFLLDNWLYNNNIKHWIMSVNWYNWRLCNVGVRIHLRKLKDIKKYSVAEQFFIKNLNLHNKMVFERYVWSYIFYSSPGSWFLTREEKDYEHKINTL